MNVSFNGRDSPMFPSLVDFYTFYHLFSGLFAYIILHKYLKISLLNSFIIFNLIHFNKSYYIFIIQGHNKLNNLKNFYNENCIVL